VRSGKGEKRSKKVPFSMATKGAPKMNHKRVLAQGLDEKEQQTTRRKEERREKEREREKE
jgi:hypothetical protein